MSQIQSTKAFNKNLNSIYKTSLEFIKYNLDKYKLVQNPVIKDHNFTVSLLMDNFGHLLSFSPERGLNTSSAIILLIKNMSIKNDAPALIEIMLNISNTFKMVYDKDDYNQNYSQEIPELINTLRTCKYIAINIGFELKECKDGYIELIKSVPVQMTDDYNNLSKIFYDTDTTIEKKEGIILNLSKKYEGFGDISTRQNRLGKGLVDTIGYVLNNHNIRHNNNYGKSKNGYNHSGAEHIKKLNYAFDLLVTAINGFNSNVIIWNKDLDKKIR